MRVSVIVPSFRSSETIGRCLRSLRSQRSDVEHEIIVVDSSDDGTAERIGATFPDVRLLTTGERLWPGAARNRGARAAHGSILAFVDADCFVGPSWLERMDAAHRRFDAPVLGNCLRSGNPESRVGTAYFLSAFSEWICGGSRSDIDRTTVRSVKDLPGNSMSVKAWAFAEFGPFPRTGLCSDSVFNWRVRSAGHELLLVSGLQTWHVNPTEFDRLIGHRVRHGSALALRRAGEHGWSSTRKLAYAVSTPLLAATILCRTVRRILAIDAWRRSFFDVAPLVLLSVVSWSIGEGIGYLRSLVSPAASAGASG